MSERTKRRLAFSSILVVILAGGAIGVAAFLGGGDAAPAQAAEDALEPPAGFDLGTEAAVERARFSGMPFLYVFLALDDPRVDTIRAAVEIPETRSALPYFTPVLVDPQDPAEAALERDARDRGFVVVVRGLGGELLGGLEEGFKSEDLARLLRSIRRNHPYAPRPSPLWSLLRVEPAAIRRVAEIEGRARAEWLVSEMARLEGEGSEAVIAIRAELAR